MKLLIVDDQPGVTEGLCHGVNWAQLGFSQVQAVNSVREARAAMLNTVIVRPQPEPHHSLPAEKYIYIS